MDNHPPLRCVFPYARNSALDSVGKFLGTLEIGPQGRILCWEAVGEAREVFYRDIRERLCNFLNNHHDERSYTSAHFVCMTLRMVGKRAKRATPVIMFTSLDKVARQQDFDMIARSGIMANYPDFGLGHSDFDATTTLEYGPSSQHDGASGGHQLSSRSSADSNIRTVTSGGVSHGGRHMLPTSHALRESSSIELPAQTSEASQTSESEFNGDDDQEKDLVKMTWQDMPYELIPQSSHLEKQSKDKNESNYKTDATYTDSGYTGSKYTINSLGTADSGYTGSKYTAESVYTDDAEPSSTKKYEYISSFASDLLSNVATNKLDDESIDIICEALPQLLKSFAAKIGSYGTMQIYRDVMVFVRRYRREIAKKMKDAYLEENNKRPDIINNSKESATYKDRVENWSLDMGNLEDPNEALSEDTSILMDDELDYYYDEDFDEANRAVDSFPEISVYKKFLSELPVYKWLLSNIHRVLSMDIPGDVQINIRQSILQHLSEPQRVSRGEMPQRYNFKFIVDWDPCLFLREQGYLERPEIAVSRAITITGSETDAQATTTTQYMNQMWPSSGIHLLDLLKVVVQDTCTLPYSCNFPDGTQLTVLSHGPRFTLQVNGISESIVEIGEQLTWLASALRSSPSQTEIVFVEARVKSEQLEEGMKGPNAKYLCNVSFVESPIVTSETANGQCWHQLFQNPVVVKGYSIPRRPTQNLGLEISLDIMAALAGTDRINTFDKKIFIKGFSTMMVPTGYSDNVILWHLFYNKEGGRISYLDSKMSHFEGLGLSDVESGRHILGWCSEVRCLSGTSEANYRINRSWLPDVHQGCKMSDTYIDRGQLITPSKPSPVIGEKDGLSRNRSSYGNKLIDLHKRYVVFWDVDSKRGWLLNGTSALLHLLRASLEYNKTDVLPYEFLFEAKNFKEAENPFISSAAMKVLSNKENLQMELYEEHETDESNTGIKYLLRNRIDDLYEILEKIIDYQAHITGEGGKLLHSAPRKDLEGWDFKDIATNEKHIKPRLAKIKTIGKGWIDFTRTLQAATLFGRGFGELIEPVTKSDVCSYWGTLPSDKYYLAATMDDLSKIIDLLGNPSANPPLLTNSHAWVLSKRDSKLSCGCGKGKGGHCELTQTIWPVQMAKGYTDDVPLPTGAVVFGHNSHVGKIWKDIGGPEDGDPPLSGEESDGDGPADSGVGPSIDSPPIIDQKHNLYKHEDYKIGIICALPKELAAVGASFDQYHPDLPRLGGDENFYCLGCIGIHNVVAACLPCDEYGISTAAGAASNMNRTFPGLKWLFVVGIGGGIPSKDHDIRLGDVIVSTKVIQHDMGKAMQKHFRFLRIANLQRPDRSLLNAISRIQANPDRSTNFLETHIQHILAKEPGYDSPSQNNDRLFEANFLHEDGQQTCQDCRGPEINRKPRTRTPHIHYGTIATGSQVVKNAALRDIIGAETGAICIEMEATGVMVTKGCLVIRGICDYADSHKNDDWHNYAAATAAAYLRYLLFKTPPQAP